MTSDDDDCDMRKIYITVTTLPSVNNCKDCRLVAYEHRHEGEVAHKLFFHNIIITQFNLFTDVSKLYSGNTCLVHGLTVHTSYAVTHPHPLLEPSMSLKYANHIVLNTCNFIHVISINLDHNQNVESNKTETINVPLVHKYVTKNTKK